MENENKKSIQRIFRIAVCYVDKNNEYVSEYLEYTNQRFIIGQSWKEVLKIVEDEMTLRAKTFFMEFVAFRGNCTSELKIEINLKTYYKGHKCKVCIAKMLYPEETFKIITSVLKTKLYEHKDSIKSKKNLAC
jgi:hypothetical protein